MGSFGPGNFDNDAALDARQEVIDYLADAVREFVESDGFCVEDIDSAIAYVAMLNAILLHTNSSPVEPTDPELLSFLKGMGGSGELDIAEVTSWKEKVLQVYDDEIDELLPEPEYKKRRRRVIAEALGQLESLVQ